MKHSICGTSTGITIALLFICSPSIYAQYPPGIMWQNSYWPDHNPVTGAFTSQDQSGEDWIYDLRLCTDNQGVVDGYICAGYSTFLNQEASPNSCNQCIGSTPEWHHFEDLTHRKGCNRGKLMEVDLDGKVKWYKTYSEEYSWFNTAIQTTDKGYLAVGLTQDLDKVYNPTALNSSNRFTCQTGVSNNRRHIYVVKTDPLGNVQWEYIYGLDDNLATALDIQCEAWDVAQMVNGNFKIVGGQITGGASQMFIMELYPNGFIHWKKDYGIPGINSNATRIARSTKPGPSKFAVVGTQDNINNPAIREAFCLQIDDNPNPTPIYNVTMAGNFGHAAGYDVIYNAVGDNILVGAIVNCNNCLYPGSEGEGMVFRLSAADLSQLGSYPVGLAATSGSPKLVKAFDLRVGVTNTADGGFAAVSSVQKVRVPDNIPPFPAGGTAPFFGKEHWNTDSYVAKFSPAGVMEWEKVFDTNDPIPQVLAYPANVKRQECLYHIVQNPDGGFTICGNDGNNFDDDYMARLFDNCVGRQTYTQTDPSDHIIDITANTTWGGSQKVLGTVRVKSGATLTIANNASIQFADTKQAGIQTGIEVEVGGLLVINPGAVLTKLQTCPNTMWDGILIKGTSLKQTSANQGRVVLNGCRIENARIAISTESLGGGILQAKYATFKNNFIDVQMNTYSAPLIGAGVEPRNLGNFQFCNFIADAFLNDPSYIYFQTNTRLSNTTHVALKGVNGVQFLGCNFKTDLTGSLGQNFMTDLWSLGIYSVDASFTVGRACNIISNPSGTCAGLNCTFENLQYGVYAQSINPLKSFTVAEAAFTNCYNNLYQSGIDYSVVKKNKFLINKIIPAPLFPLCPPGVTCPNYFVYTNQCSGFDFSENSFKVTSAQEVVGNIFNKTGNTANLVYRNEYFGLAYGIQTQQNNGNGVTGLQLKCNRNIASIKNDIRATSGGLPDQGSCVNATILSPANNTFSHNGQGGGDIWLATGLTGFNYNYILNPIGGSQDPAYLTSNVQETGCLSSNFNFAASCPLAAPPCLNCAVNKAFQVIDTLNVLKKGQMANTASDRGSNPPNAGSEEHIALLQYYENEKETAINRAIQLLLAGDSTVAESGIDMEMLLKLSGSVHSMVNLIHLYIGRGDYAKAFVLIDGLSQAPGMEQQSIFLRHVVSLHLSGRRWQDLETDATVMADMEAFASDSLADGFANAGAVLAMISGAKSYERIEGADMDQEMGQGGKEAPPIVQEVFKTIRLMAFPNPFRDELTVNFVLPPGTLNAALHLIELTTGRILETHSIYPDQTVTTIQTTELPAGVYCIGVVADNMVPGYIKLIKIR